MKTRKMLISAIILAILLIIAFGVVVFAAEAGPAHTVRAGLLTLDKGVGREGGVSW